jgi:hypothetical protein
VAAPAHAVELQRAAHAIIGHRAVLQADAAADAETRGEECAELTGAAVSVVRAKGTAVVPVRRKGAHHRFGIAGGQPVLVAADDVTGAGWPRPEDGRPDVAPLVNWPLAAVGAEHHRHVIGRFGDDRDRPRQLPPVVVQVRQQFHHGPPVGHSAGHGLGTGVQARQPGQVAADEPAQLPVAADLARARIIDHHLTRPRILQEAGITFVKRGEVLRDRISLTLGAGLLAGQLHSTDEVRKPRHRITPLHRPPGTGPRRQPFCLRQHPYP